MSLTPRSLRQYHVFLASPGEVAAERQHVRKFFDDYNRHTAHIWNAHFEVVDWENHATIGVGRPQELINRQTLEKYPESLILFVGIMGQRFGSPSGKAESGTEEEFEWAMESRQRSGLPEIKWFFRKVDKLELPADLDEAEAELAQWKKVLAFRRRMQDLNNPVFYTEYAGAAGFAEAFGRDINQWLGDPARPWAADRAAAGVTPALAVEFDAEGYRAAVLKQFDKLNFDMLDTTGACYSGVRLWRVFVPQSVRECQQLNPRLLEIPKEHLERLTRHDELTAEERAKEEQVERLRQEYVSQPLRPVLDIVDGVLCPTLLPAAQNVVILGDPGSGKSSLIRYLALRWARTTDVALRATQPISLVIELGSYGRWKCEGRKGLIRFLEEGASWYEWPPGLLRQLIGQPGRVLLLLLDGLDEIFDAQTRGAVINDVQRFASTFPQTPILVTSRVVGYQPQRLRDADFRHFMLQDLDREQITTFVDRWHEETFDSVEQAAPKRERLLKAIRHSKPIAMLAGNPLLLTMMAILNRNRELPRDRTDLYAQASRLLLEQWDTERALVDFPGLSADIGLREKTDILRRVASHMQAGPAGLHGNLIDGARLIGVIEEYLYKELHFSPARAAARAVVEHLRLRNFILCFVGTDSYAFVHRAFLEYFCAAEFVHRFNISKTLDTDGLLALFDDHCRQDEWREVLLLICGQIDEAFAGQIIDRLVTLTKQRNWDNRSYLPELTLASSILQEVRTLTKLEAVGARLLTFVLEVVTRASGDTTRLVDDLTGAVEVVGTRWPGSTALLPLALPQFSGEGEVGQSVWAKLVTALEGADASRIRDLVSTCKRKYQYAGVRMGAIRLLAESWPDETTRALLVECAIEQDEEHNRRAALEILVQKWPDKMTRALLTQRALQEENPFSREAAVKMLVENWRDETTRAWLSKYALEYQSAFSREAAVKILVENWPDRTTRAWLSKRAIEDANNEVRGVTFAALSAMHSQFGRILATRDLDGQMPYLDPLNPISRHHIEEAAKRAGVRPDDIDAEVASLSAHLGWDVTRGGESSVKKDQKRA